jgi:stage II sporulation protein D
MAGMYRDYLGDAVEADVWYGRYRALSSGASVAPAYDKRTLAVEQSMPEYIRVLVADSAAPLRISSAGVLKITADNNGTTITTVSDIAFAADNSSSIIMNGAAQLPGTLRVAPADGQSVAIDGKTYRGLLMITAEKQRLLAVNHVPLEEYLCGVLPREMAPSWPLEALKAQAVAARTYALYHMLVRRSAAYDVLSTTSSQVYGGSQQDYPAIRSAVDATRGLVLAEGGRLALTLFHANSGGRTESLEDIWGGRLSYLSSVDDPFSKNYSGDTWEKTLSAEEIASACAQFGIAADKVKEIVPIERSASGRIKKLKVVADSQTFFLSGNSFRLIVGPGKVKGTNFAVQKEKAEFVFKGTGYGHGAGMSQWGAYGMSKKGHDFTAILGHYYPGAQTVRIVK